MASGLHSSHDGSDLVADRTGAAGLPTLQGAVRLPRYRWHLGCILLKTAAISCGQGNVLRPYTTLTLSMRVPPNVVPERAGACAATRSLPSGLHSSQDVSDIAGVRVLKELLEAEPPLVSCADRILSPASGLHSSISASNIVADQGMQVTYNLKKAGAGWEAPAVAPWLEIAAENASNKVWLPDSPETRTAVG